MSSHKTNNTTISQMNHVMEHQGQVSQSTGTKNSESTTKEIILHRGI